MDIILRKVIFPTHFQNDPLHVPSGIDSMNLVKMTLPDGSVREFNKGVTPLEVAASIGKKLAADAIAARVNDKEVDLTFSIQDSSRLALITRNTKEGLEIIRHSTAHLLAHAIKELYPSTQITIGPVIEDGFYYDIDPTTPLTPEDLPKIETKMKEIMGRNLDVRRSESAKKSAVDFFRNQGEFYKAEIIEGISEPTVSLYTQGEFTDLCRGPHVTNTQRLGSFKLLNLAGAYWRGSENNKMLQRIYGTAFATQKELDEHLHRLEEMKKRDHRKLGPELGLFTFLPVAPAMPFYLPKGTLVINKLREFMQNLTQKAGYQEVMCPQLMNVELWKTSGHWDNYKENMYFAEAGEDGESSMCLKPMNCPGHCVIFGSTKHSYRELPIRYSEFSRLHRYERAGVTHGLFRTRTFAQDDGHVFCTENQIQSETQSLVRDIFRVYKHFGFDSVELKVATLPEKRIGTDELWARATQDLENALKAEGHSYEMILGEGAFYGPKIEFHIKDSMHRAWQCGTVQLDYFAAERFNLEYTESDNKPHRPVMIHRAILGSLERFMGILIEHHAGHLPFWIAPTQVTVLSVATEVEEYTRKVHQELEKAGIRSVLDTRNEKLGFKIREAQLAKSPFMVVIGPKEAEAGTLAVRKSSGENLPPQSVSEFIEMLKPLNQQRLD